MQTVSTNYSNLSKSQLRVPQFKVIFDWNLSGYYQDESEYIETIEVERNLNEPLGGVALAQADVSFINKNGRYTPPDDI